MDPRGVSIWDTFFTKPSDLGCSVLQTDASNLPLFVVETGDFSDDYGVCGIFSTRELAQAWIDKQKRPERFSVNDQWKLDRATWGQ